MKFSPSQGIVREFCKMSGNFDYLTDVRELVLNSDVDVATLKKVIFSKSQWQKNNKNTQR